MRIARAHHGPAILENRDRVDEWLPAEIDRLCGPGIDDLADAGEGHLPECQVVPGRVADHAAQAALAVRLQERLFERIRGWARRP